MTTETSTVSRIWASKTKAKSHHLELLKKFTPIVMSMARRVHRRVPKTILQDDLVSAGMGGLWDAIIRNTAPVGDEFEWYARSRIRGAILDELRRTDFLPRLARARALQAAQDGDTSAHPTAVVHFDELSEQEQERAMFEASNVEDEVANRESMYSIKLGIARLPERERYIVSQYYFNDAQFKDLVDELGISECRMSQLHTKAINWLRAELAGSPPLPTLKRNRGNRLN